MEFKVPGMMCMHCVNDVKTALEGLKGVTDVQIDLDNKTVSLTADPSIKQTIIDTIEDLGFDVE